MAAQRVVLVIGAAAQVGRAISTGLSASGFSVALHYRTSHAAAQELTSELQRSGGEAEAFQADLTDRRAIDSLVDTTLERFGRIDLLVNNAAVFDRRPLMEVDAELWACTLAVNLDASFWISQRVAALVRERGALLGGG